MGFMRGRFIRGRRLRMGFLNILKGKGSFNYFWEVHSVRACVAL